MRPRNTQIQIAYGRTIARPIQQWSHGEKLIQRKLPVKDVASRKSVSVFQILGSNDLMAQNQLRQIRSIQAQSLDHGIAERHTFALPSAVLQLVGCVLHVDRHYVLTRWRQ